MKRMSFVLIILILLSSCSTWFQPKSVTKHEYHKKPALDIGYPRPIHIETLEEYIIITPKNADKVFARLIQNGVDPSLMCLKDYQYQSQSANHDEIQRYIVELYKSLKAYKDYYEKD